MKKEQIAMCVVMLLTFALSSCSKEMEDIQDIQIDNLRKDTLLTRAYWDQEPSPMEWANTMEGTCEFGVDCIDYLYIGDEPDYKYTNNYESYAHFCWHAGLYSSSYQGNPTEYIAAEAHKYLMQIQWSYDADHWINIKSRQGGGLVRIFQSGILAEDIPAYAFPYSDGVHPYSGIYVRIRAIHEDYFGSSPDSEAEYRDKYNKSMFSHWSSRYSTFSYSNVWGYNKPQPDPNSSDEEGISESSVLAKVYLPDGGYNSIYTYSYELRNNNGYYTEYFYNSGKHKLSKITANGGTIEVTVTRRTKGVGTEVTKDYSERYDSNSCVVEIHVNERDFER